VAFNMVPEQAALTFSVRPPPSVDLQEVSAALREMVGRVTPAATLRTLTAKTPFATRDVASFGALLADVGHDLID
jgi:hypothetical protein